MSKLGSIPCLLVLCKYVLWLSCQEQINRIVKYYPVSKAQNCVSDAFEEFRFIWLLQRQMGCHNACPQNKFVRIQYPRFVVAVAFKVRQAMVYDVPAI